MQFSIPANYTCSSIALERNYKTFCQKFKLSLYLRSSFKCITMYSSEKLNCRNSIICNCYWNMMILQRYQDYHEQKMNTISTILLTCETKICTFQYKLHNNLPNLNEKLLYFGIISQSNCSFYELYDETPKHLFYECTYTQNLWNQFRLYLSEKVVLPVLTLQSVIPVLTFECHL